MNWFIKKHVKNQVTKTLLMDNLIIIRMKVIKIRKCDEIIFAVIIQLYTSVRKDAGTDHF